MIDKRNRFNIYRDNGREILQIGVSKAVYNRATRYASMRTNAEGEIYIVDEGNGRLLKYTKDFERLYCVGRTGRDSNPWDIQFMAPFGIATRGKDIFVSEVFHHNSGVQRFHNVAKILEHRIESLAYNGYNPEKCTQGKRPFPSIKFKVSEACQVRLTIYRREYDNLDSNLALTPLWADTLDTLSSGWHDHPIQWNGLDPQGNVVTGDVVFAITTHRYWSDGDDAELELFRIDRTPPHIVDLGDLQYPLYVSSVKPFHVDVPLNETAHGRMYVHNAADVVVDSVLHTPSVEDIERRYPRVRFDWPVAKLDSCEVFDVSFVFEDLAGNETETPVSLTGVTGTTLRNASGGYHRAFVPYQSQRDLTGFRKNHRAQCAYRDGCLEQLL